MRIDLGLQHLIAGILQKQLLFVVFVDQRVGLAVNFRVVEHAAQPQPADAGSQPADKHLLPVHGLHGIALAGVRQCKIRRRLAALVDERFLIIKVEF